MARQSNKHVLFGVTGFRLIALFALAGYAGIATSATDIAVDGVGASREKAVQNAILSASEQVSGVMVIGDQKLENGQITKDEVRQHTAGIVVSYETVSCQLADKLYTCRVNAKVSPMPLRLTVEGNGKDTVPVAGASAEAEVKTYARSMEESRALVLATLPEWQKSLKLTVKDSRVQPTLNGKPAMDLTYTIEVVPGYFKHLQAVLERVEETNAKLNSGSRSGYHRGDGVDRIVLDAPEIGWWPRFYFPNDPVLSKGIRAIVGWLTLLEVQINLLGRDGTVLSSGCDSVRSEFVETVFESGSLVLWFKVGGTQKRQVSFTIPEEQLAQVMGVQVSRGCTNRGGLTIVGPTR